MLSAPMPIDFLASKELAFRLVPRTCYYCVILANLLAEATLSTHFKSLFKNDVVGLFSKISLI